LVHHGQTEQHIQSFFSLSTWLLLVVVVVARQKEVAVVAQVVTGLR